MAETAYGHYRVERIQSEGGGKSWMQDPEDRVAKILRHSASRGWRERYESEVAAMPPVHDVVRILDAAGTPVFSQMFSKRYESETFEATVVSDLLRLDVETFREKYGIDATGSPDTPV